VVRARTLRHGSSVLRRQVSSDAQSTGNAATELDHDPRESAWLVGRPLGPVELTIVGAALASSLGGVILITTGGVVTDPVGFAVVVVANVLGFALAGLLWVRSRPWSIFGRVLVAKVAVVALTALLGVAVSWLFVAGVVASWISALLTTWLMLAFPSGRLGLGGRAVMAVAAATFVLIAVPQLFVAHSVTSLSAVGRCAADCPPNPLAVVDDRSLGHALSIAAGAGRTVWGIGLIACLIWTFISASRLRRRMIAPVFATALPFAVVFTLTALVVDTLHSQRLSEQWIYVSFVVTRIVVPLGFAGAILLAQAYAGVALSEMARELHHRPPLAEAEALVRRVLSDPHGQLGFWLPRLQRFVDRHGRTLALAPQDEWVSWRRFRRRGTTVLALEHDPALADYPELVDAVGSALLLAVENRQLQQDLLGSINALRASQRRIAVAAAAERRKMERDLHDSTQQKLVAVRIQLALAREQTEPNTVVRNRLTDLGREVDEVLDELRSVAHGIYPQLLHAEGLSAALREAARRSIVPVVVQIDDIDRLPEELESAIYYCCLEALQNVVKHGGDEATATVRLSRNGRIVRFTVSDDGAGFSLSARPAGVGLTNMNDRISAVGGSLSIRSRPGNGTVVDGRVVVPAAVPSSFVAPID
jgi:signal transduction histidine kinase